MYSVCSVGANFKINAFFPMEEKSHEMDVANDVQSDKNNEKSSSLCLDLSKFREAIRNHHNEVAIGLIESDSRYLINSGSDTPTIVHPMFRFNALHFAVAGNNLTMTRYILNLVSDLSFLRNLYCGTTDDFLMDKSDILLKAFLNTPSNRRDWPLHLAAKSCAVDIVEILVSFSQCETNVKNLKHETPKDIIIKYKDNTDESDYERIIKLLDNPFYVPILRYEDEPLPVVGDPFEKTCPKYHKMTALSSQPEVHAYAGPMTHTEAQQFHKKLKTPPRLTQRELLDKNQSKKRLDISLRFSEKGLERIGSNLAKEWNIDWNEYWPFLDTFTDLSSDKGLVTFEEFLVRKKVEVSKNQTLEQSQNSHQLKSVSDIDCIVLEMYPFRCQEVICRHLVQLIKKMCNEFEHNDKINVKEFEDFVQSMKKKRFLTEQNIRQIHYRLSSMLLGDFDYDTRCKSEAFLRYFHSENLLVDKLIGCVFNTLLKRFQTEPSNSLGHVPYPFDHIDSHFDFESKENIEDLFKLIYVGNECTCSPFSELHNNCDSFRDNSSDDSVSTVYYSAKSSPYCSISDLLEDAAVFIEGLSPTKSDMLAFKALETVTVDSERFPSVSTWKNKVQSFSEDTQKRWPDYKSEIEKQSVSSNDSWMRIIGSNTPEKIRKKYKDIIRSSSMDQPRGQF